MLLHLLKIQIQSATGFSYFCMLYMLSMMIYYVLLSLLSEIFNNLCHASGGIDSNQVDLIKLSDVENILNLTILLSIILFLKFTSQVL